MTGEPWIDHDEGVRVIPQADGSFVYEPLDDEEEAPAADLNTNGCRVALVVFLVGWATLLALAFG